MSCKKHVLVSNLPITQTIIVYRFATISNNLMTTESANCLTRKLCKIKSCEKLKLVIEWLCAFAKQPFLKSTISLINIEHEQGASLAVLLWQPCEILKLPKLNVHVTTSYRDSRFLQLLHSKNSWIYQHRSTSIGLFCDKMWQSSKYYKRQVSSGNDHYILFYRWSLGIQSTES